MRQYDIERHVVPLPVRPTGFIGVSATGWDGDTFEETAVRSADDSTLQLDQTPCNVAEAVFEGSTSAS